MSFYSLFHSLFLSLSLSLSSFTFSSPTLSPPRLSISLNSSSPMSFSTLYLFISLTSSSPIGFSLTFSPPQLLAPSISYLNSSLPTTPTIGDARNFFLPPMLLWWFMYERCNFFPLLLFDSICEFCGMYYY